ncbi:MAG: hypothetical protein OJI67_03095, partial [Prosthecobacter sp.]|nr:hypothetical protein [Prosthecobacter sp.]
MTTEPLRGIWGTSASNVWVVGGSTNNAFILKWNGASWSSQTVPSQTGGRLSSIWGADANNLWACGNNGRIVRTTDGGANWTVVTSPISTRLSTIWGASSTDIWAAGDGGVIIHWNGASWSVVTSPTADNHRMLWGSGASDIWLVSDNAGTNGVMHYNGSTWSVYSQSITQRPCFSVWGLDTNNVWVGTNLNSTTKVPDILKWNGSSWSQSNTGLPANTLNNTRGFAGTSASNLWLCNDQLGYIGYWNGATWTQDTSNTANSLQSIWISPAGDFLVSVGTGGVIVTLVPPSLADAPTVTTPTSASVTENSATLGGNVTADGGASITERGVVYALTATNANPEIAGTGVVKVAGTGTTGVFTVSA